MKVLMACDELSYKNPYVKTLVKGLKELGCDIVCSLSEFWHPTREYSIVHIQWPDLLPKTPWSDCKDVEKRLLDYKSSGVKIIATCHNLLPHYSTSQAKLTSYKLVYEYADCIVHLGHESIDMLKQQMPNLTAEHVVIPHHAYDELYQTRIDKCEARKKLNVPAEAKCIMSFGSFRDDEERALVLSLIKSGRQDYYYLMPGFFRDAIIRKNIPLGIKNLFRFFKYTFIAWKNNIAMSHRYIPDEQLPLYMAAADVLLVQRKKILNSGNVSLAMLFGLPIVGPNVGNVGSILKSTGNYVFDVNDLSSLANAVEKSFADENLGRSNEVYANDNLTTNRIASMFFEQYKRLAKGDSK